MPQTLTDEQIVGGRYALGRKLREGGMGAVWLARDTVLERDVAIKQLAFPAVLADSERSALRVRIVAEAEAVAGLGHPGAVEVVEVLEQDGHVLVVTEFVDAPTLAQLVARRGPLRAQRVAALGLELLAPLVTAHARGLVHRFVQPATVLMPDQGGARLLDFGLLALIGDPKVTLAGDVAGIPYYLSPEQAARQEIGPAADLWSLGATLYFAVEGQPPFGSRDPAGLLAAIANNPPRPPIDAGPLEPVLDALLAKNPRERPSPDALRTMLEDVATQPPPPLRSDTVATGAGAALAGDNTTTGVDTAPLPPAPPRRRGRRLRRLLAGAGALAIIAMLLALLATNGRVGRDAAATSTVPATTSPPQTTAPTATTVPLDIPSDWVRYQDEATGFSLYYPPGWTVGAEPGAVEIREPGPGAVLRLTAREPPEAVPPDEFLRQQEAAYAVDHPDYGHIQLTATNFDGLPAALWEYIATEADALKRVVNLTFTSARYTFAIVFSTQADDWERVKPAFYDFAESFDQPPP